MDVPKSLEKYQVLENFSDILKYYNEKLAEFQEAKQKGTKKIYSPESTALNVTRRKFFKQFKAIDSGVGPIPAPDPKPSPPEPKPEPGKTPGKKLFDFSIFK